MSDSKCRPWAELAAVLLVVLPFVGCGRDARPPANLVFVSLDTTRQDHLSVYGYERTTSPALDALAARSALFENAVAQMAITNPSHASMFSGLYPKTHLVGENTRQLADRFLTLPEILAAVGFRTGGFVSGQPLKPEITGIDQGFEIYDGELQLRRDGAETTDLALAWLAGVGADERFFLFVHYYDVHGPYRLKPEYEQLFASPTPGERLRGFPDYQRIEDAAGRPIRHANQFLDRYDRMVRFQDDQLARILDAVDLDDTAVIIVADHGETLFDRQRPYNLNHGTTVFDEQMLIPLVIYAPGVEPARHPHVVETVDLLPTALDVLGLARPPGWRVEGESLWPIIDGERHRLASETGYSSSQVRLGGYSHRGWKLREDAMLHSVRTRQWKLILYPGVDRDHVELFDLERDPGERWNVAHRYPERRDQLLEVLAAWRTADPAPDSDEQDALSPEDIEGLRALGYVGG